MSGNVFKNAQSTSKQSRIEELRKSGELEPDVKLVYHSARVPEQLSRSVKRLAVDHGSSVQELTVEALRLLLKKYKVETGD